MISTIGKNIISQKQSVYHMIRPKYAPTPTSLPSPFLKNFKIMTIATKTQTSDESEQKEQLEAIQHKVENPLDVMKSFSRGRNFCDENGFRKGMVHWTFAIAINDVDGNADDNCKKKAPVLRTVNFQRISPHGVDFIMKNRGHSSDLLFIDDQHVSFLFTEGKYLPGQKVEQWRAQGRCNPIRLQEVLRYAPNSTVVEMIASVRANKEGDARDDMDLSHILELVQETRAELDKGDISKLELDEAIRAWRFVPYKIERMIGGPNQPMWDRREWVREEVEGSEWIEPKRLMPF